MTASSAKYYRNPEITAVANALYGALDDPATANRADIGHILLKGINIPDSATVPGGLQFTRTGPTEADMLRVNTGIKPNAMGACVFGAPADGRAASARSPVTCAASRTAVDSSTTSWTSSSGPSSRATGRR